MSKSSFWLAALVDSLGGGKSSGHFNQKKTDNIIVSQESSISSDIKSFQNEWGKL